MAGVQGAAQSVFDDAGLFTAEEKQRLEEHIELADAGMDWDVYVVTTSDAGAKPPGSMPMISTTTGGWAGARPTAACSC